MASKRIDYIDYMKGLSIIWVVWYHTVHPWFVDFSFRIPLFFLVSGIFFKVIDIQIFAKKKFNQLVIPFFFFYAVYFVYLMAQFYGKYGSLETFNFNMFFEIFHLHKNFESFTVNPPLMVYLRSNQLTINALRISKANN